MRKGIINLLPPEHRQNLRRGFMMLAFKKLLRVVVLGLIVMTASGLALAGWFWFQMQAVSDVELAQALDQRRAYQGLKTEIKNKNAVIEQLRQLEEERMVWSNIIAAVLKEISPGIELYSLTAESSADKRIVRLTGKALTRNELVSFEQRLENLKWVREVIAPRTNLLRATEATFSLDIELNLEEINRLKGVNNQ